MLGSEFVRGSSLLLFVGIEGPRYLRRPWLESRYRKEENLSLSKVRVVLPSVRDNSRGLRVTAANHFPKIRFRLRVAATQAAMVPVFLGLDS